VSDGPLWITGPYGLWVAEDHVVALADLLSQTANACAEVARRIAGVDAPVAELGASLDWDVVARHARRVEDLAATARAIAQALRIYARNTADQERARQANFDAPRERMFAAVVIAMTGSSPQAPWRDWGLPLAAGTILSPQRIGDRVVVHPWDLAPGGRVTRAVGLEQRILRIPPSHTPIRIERYAEDGGLVNTEVFIAGTSDWGVGYTENPFDLESNMALVAGLSSASRVAVEMALQRAGVVPGDRVTFVGHSQGGVIAARLAESGRYTTTGLITVGAPIGGTPVEGDYPAVSIAHSDDLVPGLGGVSQPTRSLGVERHSGAAPGNVSDAHSLERYAQTAREIDESPASSHFGGFGTSRQSSEPQYFRATRHRAD
jgi:surfactin synthase thioesterase subunit